MASPIVFQCPACKKELRAPIEKIGVRTRCTCGAEVAVPAMAIRLGAPPATIPFSKTLQSSIRRPLALAIVTGSVLLLVISAITVAMFVRTGSVAGLKEKEVKNNVKPKDAEQFAPEIRRQKAADADAPARFLDYCRKLSSFKSRQVLADERDRNPLKAREIKKERDDFVPSGFGSKINVVLPIARILDDGRIVVSAMESINGGPLRESDGTMLSSPDAVRVNFIFNPDTFDMWSHKDFLLNARRGSLVDVTGDVFGIEIRNENLYFMEVVFHSKKVSVSPSK